MNPLHPKIGRGGRPNAAKLYGAIVAQARLPVFYRSLFVPDTLQGRFLVLSLHLFAVQYRLKEEGAEALNLSQELSDRFSEDMEIVLREVGVGDLSIPKKMRGLAASNAALFSAYAKALPAGEQGLAQAIAEALPPAGETLSGDATGKLARYVIAMAQALRAQPLAALRAGEVRFPDPCEQDPARYGSDD